MKTTVKTTAQFLHEGGIRSTDRRIIFGSIRDTVQAERILKELATIEESLERSEKDCMWEGA